VGASLTASLCAALFLWQDFLEEILVMSEIFSHITSQGWVTEGVALVCLFALGYFGMVKRTDKIIDKAWENFYWKVLEQNDGADQKLETMIFIAKAMRAGFTLISELLLLIAVALCVIAYVLIS
jgi:hypothetical protein